MGIQGLLSLLRTDDENSAIKAGHLGNFRDKTAAIDAYSWLHKSVFSCANDLFMGKPTTKYIDYCLRQVKMLKQHGIKPILVFDGGRMPLKVVDEKRRADRKKAKLDANNLIAMGQTNQAFNQIVQSIDITHEMASNLIKAVHEIGVESIVAPYEADPQLVYLEKVGIVDFIISEDSDLIIFGAKTVFLKLSNTGTGEIYSAENLDKILLSNRKVRCSVFKFEKFRHAAILSGCDYLKNVPGVGLHKAWKFMNMTENTNVWQFLKKLPRYLNINAVIDVDFIRNFINADFAFQYQIVYDPRNRMRIPMNPVEEITQDYIIFENNFPPCDNDHFQLALGNIDTSGRQYDDYHPPSTSYLYSGSETKTRNTNISPTIGFITEGVYKRKLKPKGAEDNVEINEIVDLLEYYKNLDTTPRRVEIKQTDPEPPAKKIKKCIFAKSNVDFNSLDPTGGLTNEMTQKTMSIEENNDDEKLGSTKYTSPVKNRIKSKFFTGKADLADCNRVVKSRFFRKDTENDEDVEYDYPESHYGKQTNDFELNCNRMVKSRIRFFGEDVEAHDENVEYPDSHNEEQNNSDDDLTYQALQKVEVVISDGESDEAIKTCKTEKTIANVLKSKENQSQNTRQINNNTKSKHIFPLVKKQTTLLRFFKKL